MSFSVRSFLVFLLLATAAASPFLSNTNELHRKAGNSSSDGELSMGCRLCRKIALDEITVVADQLKISETFILNICNKAFGLLGAVPQLYACTVFVKGNLDRFIQAFSDPKQEQLRTTAVCRYLHLCKE